MSHLNEPDLIAMSPQRFINAVDTVAGQGKNGVDLPGDQALNQ
jgi:hypothetical protein